MSKNCSACLPVGREASPVARGAPDISSQIRLSREADVDVRHSESRADLEVAHRVVLRRLP